MRKGRRRTPRLIKLHPVGDLLISWSVRPMALLKKRCGLSVPAQSLRLLCCEMQKIEEAVVAFNVSEDVSNIRATWQERIHNFNHFVFIAEEALASFSLFIRAGCPRLDADNIVLRVVSFKSAGKMDQVAPPMRWLIRFTGRMTHALANSRRLLFVTRVRARRL